jgi:heme exporter protein A
MNRLTQFQDEQASTTLLEARGLECIRGDRILFTNLSFKLSAGTALRVEGPNGAGKTSLLRILCGLSLPSEGEVCWRGGDITKLMSEFLDEVAYVGHIHGVKGDLTPLENLDIARSLAGIAQEITSAEALAVLGLEGYEDLPCRMLSAGQRRRVALARLLVVSARLWILDEPYTALDTTGIATVEVLITEHLISGGVAVFTSHQPITLGDQPIDHISLSPHA